MDFHGRFKTPSAYDVAALLTVCCLMSGPSSQQAVKKLDLNEGEICRKGRGSDPDYTCARGENCDSVFIDKVFKNQSYPDLCSFVGSNPIICCPPTDLHTNRLTAENGTVADEKCRQYSKLWIARREVSTVHEYATTSTELPSNCVEKFMPNSTKKHVTCVMFVFGGKNAEPMEFPHMVLLGYGERAEDDDWGCGGSLVSDRWILTAAHCRQRSSSTPARWARVGDLNTRVNTDRARPKDYRIERHAVHPDYEPPSLYNDIALFRLENRVEFSAYVRPICLNSDPLFNPTVQFAAGWGRTSTDGPVSEHLMKVDLNVFPAALCNRSYANDRKLASGILTDRMICAGSIDGKRDTCIGDSGGPLHVHHFDHKHVYIQTGITSFGRFCGDKDTPSVYTRVSKYISWIERIVWPEEML